MKFLAYRIYPEPKGTTYYSSDLDTEQKVIELFDYCQILEAIITKERWLFLMDTFGLKKLFELNNISGWQDCDTISEYKLYIEGEIQHK
ncbi:hypothetical protein [uncultured Dokdonia sp.]|uniref:hypothetical protein n=1 Tax=uncultured Dokdonia sp. TaxID=575653 RepID=UPI002602D8F5|nr:hypothetical protein [uncultured Dokdonia sp.]